MRRLLAMAALALLGTLAWYGAGLWRAGRVSPGERVSARGDLLCDDCNLLIISLTNTRRDHLESYGYGRATSTAIARFFADGLAFDNAFAAASWTLPVAASLHTSLFPYSHGVMDRYGGSSLPRAVTTLAEVLRGAGFATAAFTGGGDYHRSYGLDRGFDTYLDEESSGLGAAFAFSGLEHTLPAALAWLERHRERRFFMLLQGFDAHCPFTPKPPYDRLWSEPDPSEPDFSRCLWSNGRAEPRGAGEARRLPLAVWDPRSGLGEVELRARDVARLIDLYDGEIAAADAALATLFHVLEERQLASRTVVVFMSEHGDLFGEHGRFMRGGPLVGTFFEPVLGFPLLVKHPRAEAAGRSAALVQTVDLMPTLLEMLAVEDPDAGLRQGRSVLAVMAGKPDVNDAVFAGARFRSRGGPTPEGAWEVEAIRDGRWKLLVERTLAPADDAGERAQLYEVAVDGDEAIDLSERHPEVAARLRARLERWRQGQGRLP